MPAPLPTEPTPRRKAPWAAAFAAAPQRPQPRPRAAVALVCAGALAGELVALDNHCERVPLIDGIEKKLHALESARVQALHVTWLESLCEPPAAGGGAAVADPRWKRLRRDFSAAAKRADLAACAIIQDLMLPTMGLMLYGMLESDAAAAAVARRILGDERRQLDGGIAAVGGLLRRDPKAVNRSLAWAHRRVMPGLVGMASAGCHALCGGVAPEPGDAAGADREAAALEGHRADLLEAYRDTLDRAGFDENLTLPLIAGIAGSAADEPGRPRVEPRLRIGAPPVLAGAGAS